MYMLGEVGNDSNRISMTQKIAEDGSEGKMEEINVESRFGTISVNPENAIFFPQGLLGLPENLHFALSDIPKENMGGFKLLQCLNDHSLSFVVLPLDMDNNLIERKDLQECCNILGIPEKSFLGLLIVSVQRSPDSVKITANLRAPVMVDSDRKIAVQYVFPHNRYEITHMLSKQ